MFQVFGNEVYSTDEICKILQNKYGITVITDLTKSTDRDDRTKMRYFKRCFKYCRL